MPVACGNTVLTGANGSIAFVPAGTKVCLRDSSDFDDSTSKITLPADHGFQVGDKVDFTAKEGATLDTGLTTATDYRITALEAGPLMTVVKDSDNSAVSLASTGADTALPAHIEVAMTEFEHVCNVRSFSISLDRESIDTTSLMCACSSGTTANLAEFRTAQAGFASGEGTMEVMFTESQTNLANRLLKDSLKKNQDGAEVRLYINTVCNGTSVDDAASLYIEAPISIMGFSINVTPEDVITATVNFSFSGQPTEVL